MVLAPRARWPAAAWPSTKVAAEATADAGVALVAALGTLAQAIAALGPTQWATP